MKYKVKNWDEFQQYKDNRPLHWIKLHNSLLDDFTFNKLSESHQLQLLKLWLVASKNGGNIEGDEKWLAKLTNLKKIDIDQLLKSGFIIRTDASTEPYETVPRESREEREDSSKKTTFKKPTIEEINVYLTEQGISDISAEKFFNHYEANGWMRGKNKIVSWKACVKTWAGRNNDNSPKKSLSSYMDNLL